MKNYDIYGQPFKLHIAGHYTTSSTFGGFLSILTVILMIIYVCFNGTDMFLRKDPITWQEIQTLNFTHALNFTNSEFRFYFNLFYGLNKSVFEDPTYLKIKFISKFRENNNTILKTFNLTKCSYQNFQNQTHADNSLIQKRIVEKNYYCPDFTNFTLSGSWIENQIEFGQIQVYPCNNKTDNVKCKSFDEINTFVLQNKIYISLYYPLSVVKLSHYLDPIYYNLKEDYFYIRDFSKYSFYYYYFDKILISTDSGVLVPSEGDHEGVSMNLISNDERVINTDDPYVFSVDFYSSFNLVKYQRSYIKILDIIANFGGMMQIITILFQTIVSFFHTLQRVKLMTDKLFIYEDPFKIKNAYDDNIILRKLTNIQEKIKETQRLGYYNKHKNKNKILIKNFGNNIEKKEFSNLDYKKSMSNYIKNSIAGKVQLLDKQIFINKLKDQSKCNINNNKKNIFLNHINQSIELKDLRISKNIYSNHNYTYRDLSSNSLIKVENFNNDNSQIKPDTLINSKKTLYYTNKPNSNNFKAKFENITDLNLEDQHNIPNTNMIIDLGLFKDSERQKFNRIKINKNQNMSNKRDLNQINLKESLKIKSSDDNDVPNEMKSNFDLETEGSENKRKLKFIKKLLDHKKSDSIILSFSQKFNFVFRSCINLKKLNDKTEKKLLLLMNEIDEKIESYFDFLNIIKVIEEANLIKHIVMSSQQKLLMELLRKEYVSIHDIEQINDDYSIKFLKEKKNTDKFDDDKIIEAVNSLFNSYQRDFDQEGLNNSLKINNHFIEILEEKIQL